MIFPVNHVPGTKSVIGFSFMLALVFLGGCKKGDTGPAGSANVLYSDWFTATPWAQTTVYSMKNFDYTRAAPGITQNVLDSGVVLTFGKLSGYSTSVWPAGQVSQLPVILTYNVGGVQTDTWSALVTLGSLRINFVNNANYYASISTAHSFRYIIVPGAVKTGRRMDLRSMSYDEVCDYLNIPR
jgi:hypothetical protein